MRLDDYNEVKDELVLCLQMEENIKEGVFSIPVKGTDMAATFRISLAETQGHMIGALIGEGAVKGYGVPLKTIFTDAVNAGEKRRPPVLRSMESVLDERILGIKPSEGEEDDLGDALVYATVKGDVYGAAVMFYPGFLKKAEERLGGGFYIIPSSSHELLFLRERDCESLWETRELIRMVNTKEVEVQDRLSDELFYSKEGKLYLVNTDNDGRLEEISLELP